MPTIPQSYGPTVRREALPAPLANPGMASAAAFGAPIAEGAQRAARLVYEANKQAEEDRDTIDAMDAHNAFLEEDNARMTEYRARTGGNAKGLLEEASTDYRKRQDAHGAKLTSPGAKEKFRQITDQRWATRNSAILGEHQADQIRRYQIETLDSTVKNVHLDALNDGSDEALIEADRRAYLTRQRMADMTGADPQTVDLMHRADREGLFSSAVEQDIDADNWKGAKARLDKFGDAISKEKRTVLEAKIREGGLNQKAQDTADAIIKSGYAGTRADANRMIKAIDDADLSDRVRAKIDREFVARDAALAEARGATYEEIAKEVDAGADVETLLAKHSNAAALEQSDKDNLRRVADRAAERKETPDGSDEFYALRYFAASAPQAFLGTDLRLYKGVVSKREYNLLNVLKADMTSSALSTAAKGEEKPARGFLSEEDIANGILESIGIPPGVRNGLHDPRALAFKRQFNRAIVAAGGSDKLKTEQMEQIGKRLVAIEHRKVARADYSIIGMFDDGFYEAKFRAFELPDADDRAFSLEQIPASEIPKIRESLLRKGRAERDITEDDIITTYNATPRK